MVCDWNCYVAHRLFEWKEREHLPIALPIRKPVAHLVARQLEGGLPLCEWAVLYRDIQRSSSTGLIVSDQDETHFERRQVGKRKRSTQNQPDLHLLNLVIEACGKASS